jgi:hypothetical protein
MDTSSNRRPESCYSVDLRNQSITASQPRKHSAVFVAQVLASTIVIVAAIYNLSVSDHNTTLWTALLSANIGYLLPSPSLKQGWRQLTVSPPPPPTST